MMGHSQRTPDEWVTAQPSEIEKICRSSDICKLWEAARIAIDMKDFTQMIWSEGLLMGAHRFSVCRELADEFLFLATLYAAMRREAFENSVNGWVK